MEEKLRPHERRLTVSLTEHNAQKLFQGLTEVRLITCSSGMYIDVPRDGFASIDVPASSCSAEFAAWSKANIRRAKVVALWQNYVILEACNTIAMEDKPTDTSTELPQIWEGWITGLSHHSYKEVKRILKEGSYVGLQQITDNIYDPEAIAVMAMGKQIGWIPKNDKGILPMVLLEHERSGEIRLSAKVVEHHEMQSGDTHYQTCIKLVIRSNYWQWKGYQDTVRAQFSAVTASQPSKEERIKQMPGQSNYSGGLFASHEAKQQAAQFLSKETKMTKLNQIVDTNKTAISTAAQLEAGRIANKYASKLISGKLPLMVRGYADTPVARLLLANTVSFVATNYSDKLGDKAPIVQSVADAMVVSAYSEMLAHFDIDGFIEDFLSSKEMKRVGSLLKTDEEEAPVNRRRRNVNEEGDK